MVYQVVVTDNREQTAQQIGTRFRLSKDQTLSSVQLLIGSVEQIAEALWIRRESFGISYIVVNEDQMDSLAPVVARLANK